MNYALAFIAAILERTKVVAMLKCCGASGREIFGLFFYEPGIFAYLGDEIKRRQQEIGVRKINGATTLEIIWLFLKENTYLLLPAVIIGTAGGYFWGEYWFRNFGSVRSSRYSSFSWFTSFRYSS